MDSRFRIGNFRFGLDPILNFIPFGGQIATFIISLVLVSVMYRNGASSKVAVKMLLNVTWDALLGSIPIFGNVFDFFNKANEKMSSSCENIITTINIRAVPETS